MPRQRGLAECLLSGGLGEAFAECLYNTLGEEKQIQPVPCQMCVRRVSGVRRVRGQDTRRRHGAQPRDTCPEMAGSVKNFAEMLSSPSARLAVRRASASPSASFAEALLRRVRLRRVPRGHHVLGKGGPKGHLGNILPSGRLGKGDRLGEARSQVSVLAPGAPLRRVPYPAKASSPSAQLGKDAQIVQIFPALIAFPAQKQ